MFGIAAEVLLEAERMEAAEAFQAAKIRPEPFAQAFAEHIDFYSQHLFEKDNADQFQLHFAVHFVEHFPVHFQI